MTHALHFVGFRDERFYRAARVFGRPDFIHRHWDGRAASMIAADDVAIFADGDEHDLPRLFSFDDSGVM